MREKERRENSGLSVVHDEIDVGEALEAEGSSEALVENAVYERARANTGDSHLPSEDGRRMMNALMGGKDTQD